MKNTIDELKKLFSVAFEDDPLYSFLPKAPSGHEPVIVLNAQGQPVGMFMTGDLFKHKKRIPYRAKVKNYTNDLVYISRNTSLWRVAEIMLSFNCSVLPVFNEKVEIVDKVSAYKLMKSILQDQVVFDEVIKQLSIQKPVTLSVHSDVGQVYSTMKKYQISRIVLTDTRQKLCGIISRSDLARYTGRPSPHQRFSTRLGNPENFSKDNEEISRRNANLGSLYESNVYTVSLDADVKLRVLMKLSEGFKRSIVVVDDKNYPVGIVTVKDVLMAINACRPKEHMEIKISRQSKFESILMRQYLEETLYALAQNLSKRYKVHNINVGVNSHITKEHNVHSYNLTIQIVRVGLPDIIVYVKGRRFIELVAELKERVKVLAE